MHIDPIVPLAITQVEMDDSGMNKGGSEKKNCTNAMN